jgi:hypothetical protein
MPLCRAPLAWTACLAAVLVAGCGGDNAHTEFIEVVQKGKNSEIGPGMRLSENYNATYKITKEESETVPYTAIVTIEPKTTGATWKLMYEYRDNQWRFLRDKSRKFLLNDTEGSELTDDDVVWKKFATKDI